MPEIYLSRRKPFPPPHIPRQEPLWGAFIGWVVIVGAFGAVAWWGVYAIAVWLHHIAELALR